MLLDVQLVPLFQVVAADAVSLLMNWWLVLRQLGFEQPELLVGSGVSLLLLLFLLLLLLFLVRIFAIIPVASHVIITPEGLFRC